MKRSWRFAPDGLSWRFCSQVARRNAVNTNLIFKWLKEPRFALGLIEGSAKTVFLPVEVGPPDFEAEPVPELSEPVIPSPGRIEIEFTDGYRVSAEGEFDPEVLALLLKRILS